MSHNPRSGLAEIQEPAGEPCLDVLNLEGELIGRVPFSKAVELFAARLVSPIGRRRVKYLLLNGSEPTIERPYRGGSHTTRRITVSRPRKIGAGNWALEHKPLPRES
jgi:hypothetical protein